MRIEQLCFRLTVDAVNDLLVTWLQAEQLKQLHMQFHNGALHVQGDYRWGMLTMPIDLAVRVAAVNPDRVEFHVSSGNLSAVSVQELLRTLIKNSGIAGFDITDSGVSVNVTTVAAAVGVTVHVRTLTFDDQGVELSLHGMELPRDIVRALLTRKATQPQPVGV